MKKVFVIVLIGISFPVLSAIVLYSVSFCFSMIGPPAEYGTEIKDRVQYVSSEHGNHLIYNGSKYYLNDMFSCFHSSEEKLDIISWSYGFPFRAAFVYRAPDTESPDYIVGYHEIYFKEGCVPENGIYSIENSSAEICLSQIYKHGDSKDLSYDYLVSDFNMYSETCPGLYLDVSIFKFEETYYISFNSGMDSYEITDDFLQILKEDFIINVPNEDAEIPEQETPSFFTGEQVMSKTVNRRFG